MTEPKIETKNNWNDIFTDVSNKQVQIFDKTDKEIFKIDALIGIIISLFIPLVAVIFVIMVATNNWYFRTKGKE